jgi:PelA/Pel-15E family pectate lyase
MRHPLASLTGLALVTMVEAATPDFSALLDKYRSTSFQGKSETYGLNITTWQMPHGGFSKESEDWYESPWDGAKKRSVTQGEGGVDLGMFDNSATVDEVRFLAVLYKSSTNVSNRSAFKASVGKAIGFILASQYPSGGWPQMYPSRGSGSTAYSNLATFNDNAMIRVMVLVKDILDRKAPFDNDLVEAGRLPALKTALDRGVDFILKSQIRTQGVLTGWCQQHDPVTYAPKAARSYELPSKSGSESVGITAFLMNWPDQDTSVRIAVSSALAWYAQVEHKDRAYSNGTISTKAGSSIWYRFYNLEDNRPFFCDRDGIKVYDLTLVSEERRTGYQWAGEYGKPLLQRREEYLKAYPVDGPTGLAAAGKRLKSLPGGGQHRDGLWQGHDLNGRLRANPRIPTGK